MSSVSVRRLFDPMTRASTSVCGHEIVGTVASSLPTPLDHKPIPNLEHSFRSLEAASSQYPKIRPLFADEFDFVGSVHWGVSDSNEIDQTG